MAATVGTAATEPLAAPAATAAGPGTVPISPSADSSWALESAANPAASAMAAMAAMAPWVPVATAPWARAATAAPAGTSPTVRTPWTPLQPGSCPSNRCRRRAADRRAPGSFRPASRTPTLTPTPCYRELERCPWCCPPCRGCPLRRPRRSGSSILTRCPATAAGRCRRRAAPVRSRHRATSRAGDRRRPAQEPCPRRVRWVRNSS